MAPSLAIRATAFTPGIRSAAEASIDTTPRRRALAIGGALAAPVRSIFGFFGDHTLMLFNATAWLFRPPFRLRLFLEQMEFVGVGSLPIIILVGFFSGAVSAQQTIRALEIFGQEHYVGATVGLSLALELAPQFIRVNSIHPTQVDTPMIQNEATYRLFRPDLDHPTRADFEPASQAMNALPIPWVEPVDISNALLFLASDEARYITGVTLPVDAGTVIK